MEKDEKYINLNQREAVNYIVDNSVLIKRLSYDEKNSNSWELRAQINSGKSFILNRYEQGFEIYVSSYSNSIVDALELFDEL